jgi:hypothetical protein
LQTEPPCPACHVSDPALEVVESLWRDAPLAPVSRDAEPEKLSLCRFDAAIVQYRKAIDSGFRRSRAYAVLAAAYAHADKMDEAKTVLAEADPAITVKWMKEHAPNLPAVFDGLRKAGMPEA